MRTSETINELATALCKAQAQIEGAKKGKENPHFRSKYADLGAVWDACREALTGHGLSVVQSPRTVLLEAGLGVEVETRLLHTSGQWMEDTLMVPVGKPDAQGVGSAVTYARRYALAAFVGVSPEDDDGNAASARTTAQPEPAKAPAGFADWFDDLAVVAESGTAALQKAWTDSDPKFREYASKVKRDQWSAMKAKAAAKASEAVMA
jgi:hypothetical protein